MSEKPPMTRTDKLCCLLVVLTFFASHFAVWAMDEAAYRAADNPTVFTESVKIITPIDATILVDAVEVCREEKLFWDSVPLDQECQKALVEACEASEVPITLAIGLIEVESGFNAEAVSSKGAYGLCQLNPKYFPSDLTHTENIRAGVDYLGELLERCKDTSAALRTYNLGYDDGDRKFANGVLVAAEKYRKG